MQQLIEEFDSEQKTSHPGEFGIGDTVRVHFRIIEGKTERTQLFEGTCIAKKGSGVFGGRVSMDDCRGRVISQAERFLVR